MSIKFFAYAAVIVLVILVAVMFVASRQNIQNQEEGPIADVEKVNETDESDNQAAVEAEPKDETQLVGWVTDAQAQESDPYQVDGDGIIPYRGYQASGSANGTERDGFTNDVTNGTVAGSRTTNNSISEDYSGFGVTTK